MASGTEHIRPLLGFRSIPDGAIKKENVIALLARNALLVDEDNAYPVLKKYFELGHKAPIEELIEVGSPLEKSLEANFEVQHWGIHKISRFKLTVDGTRYAEEHKAIHYEDFKQVVIEAIEKATGTVDHRKAIIVLKLMDEEVLRDTLDMLIKSFPMDEDFIVTAQMGTELEALYDSEKDIVTFKCRFKVVRPDGDGGIETFVSMMTSTEYNLSKLYEKRTSRTRSGSFDRYTVRLDRIARRVFCSLY